MTENEQKQQLSFAYVHAVAARAGFACDRPGVDDDSVDLVIAAQGRIHDCAVLRSPRIELQVKATVQNDLSEDPLAFPLPIKNYNDLREETLVPRLLVILQLPQNTNEWLEQSEQQMISRRFAVYSSLLGRPKSENTATVTVHLPQNNMFSVDSLKDMMQRVSERQPL